MEEIDLSQLLKYYLKMFPLIIIWTLLLGLLGYFYSEYMILPMYESSTTILLADMKEETLTQSELSLNENLVTTYSEIITSKLVLEKVIEELELDTSVEYLKNQIYVSTVSDTPIINIEVYNSNSEMASTIANKVREVFKEEITNIYNIENISILEEAVPSSYPYNINTSSTIIIFSLIGFIISFILIFILFYFDPTIKDKQQIETYLSLEVISEIPTIKLKKENKTKLSKILNTLTKHPIKLQKPKEEVK